MVMRATALCVSQFACVANETTSSGSIKPSSDALGNWELIAQVFPNVVRCEKAFSPRNLHNGSVNLVLLWSCPTRIS
jgi:hypothetical protein